MKTKITYVFILASLLLFSCNDDFMERYPLSSLSSPTYWNNETDLKLYNNTFYEYARLVNFRMLIGHRRGSFHKGQTTFDGMTDNEVRQQSYYPYYVKIRAGQLYADQITAEWGWSNTHFELMRAINIGLANYDKADLLPETINNYKAEACLFRAWAVSDKVSLYGDFPWIDKELNIDSPELYAERTPRETVMEHVLADLDFACNNLPDDWGDGNAPGRLNRWCALLIKSRVCLFEGTWRKYHGLAGADTWLEEAADAAGELINQGPYTLYSTSDPAKDYNAIFRMTDLTGVDEVMYWRRYVNGTVNNRIQNYLFFSNPSKSMVEDYLCTDGEPITTSPSYQGDSVYEDLFENRDPRLRQSVLHPDDAGIDGYDYYGFSGLGLSIPNLHGMNDRGSFTGYHDIKYFVREQQLADLQGTMPAVILRFGETLLNYAEAKAELGTLTQADLNMSINKLRDRVGMPQMNISNVPVDPRYTGDGVSPLIVEIRRERRVELYAEGFRYNDLRRWKQGEKLKKKDYGIRWDAENRDRHDPDGLVTLYYEVEPESGIEYICPNKGGPFENPVFEDKHYLWPVPVDALALNPNLKQNPGW